LKCHRNVWNLTVLGMVDEMEHGFIKERQRAGIEAAKA
jgi:DNA invertase Pin-like site-specific DNA recombinase